VRPPDTDLALVRRAAVRLAWQFAAVAAGLIVLAVVGALVIEAIVHGSRAPDLGGRRIERDGDDGVLRTAIFIAGAVAIVVAGLAGFWLAERAVAPLGDALERQRRFVADAGHELRTPLTVLHTRAQLVVRRMRTDDPARPDAQLLLEDSRVLADIVEELLESAQLAAGATQGEPVDLNILVDQVATSMRALAENAGIHLLAVTAPDGQITSGSERALRRALTSLVDNALGHTASGGTVQIVTEREGQFTIVAVLDDGEGLAVDAEQLVQRFARGTTRTDGPTGRRFGLGLALVRDIAAAHGGRFALANRSGGGVRAAIYLPTDT
jgi:signal transduction histidine kinase